MAKRVISMIAVVVMLLSITISASADSWGHGWCTKCMDSNGDYHGYVDYYCGGLYNQYSATHTHLFKSCTYTGQERYQYLACNYCGTRSGNLGHHDCWEYHPVTDTTTYTCNYIQ